MMAKTTRLKVMMKVMMKVKTHRAEKTIGWEKTGITNDNNRLLGLL